MLAQNFIRILNPRLYVYIGRMFSFILTVFFAANALFWGLFPHSVHCKVAAASGIKSCPPHWMHLTIGFVSFLLAILAAQWGYIVAGMPY